MCQHIQAQTARGYPVLIMGQDNAGECRAHGDNFMDNGGNIFVLYEFIEYMNSYII
jgi:hypothetical protein